MEQRTSHPEREWILIGLAESCAARGFEATSVAEIYAAGGVTEEQFARLFASPDECLGAATEWLIDLIGERLRERVPVAAPWGERLESGVVAVLEALAERPAFAHVALIEAPAAGGRAAALYDAAKAALAQWLDEGRKLQGRSEVPASAARAALAGVEGLAAGRVLNDRGDQLERIAPEAIYLLAVPYLGRDEARRLASKAMEPPVLRAVA